MREAGILLLAFAAGGIPFSNFASRIARGIDLRRVGSGSVTGSSLYRTAGVWPVIVSGILDVGKGVVPPLLAGHDDVLAAFAGMLVIVGHNWSPFLRFGGGRGIAPALGVCAVNGWPGAPLLLGSLIAGKLFGETGVGGFLGELALTPVLALTNGGAGALAGAVVAAPMLVKRIVADGRPPTPGWRPYVRRLVFDRPDEPAAVPGPA
jgi:acyl phosphate:glycerol-3-phosphate acyltransferase